MKCIKFLTFLDYPTVEEVGADFESKLEERDQQIEFQSKEIKILKRRTEVLEPLLGQSKKIIISKMERER